MSYVSSGRERESRHLWVGGLPDDIDEAGIKEYFSRHGKIEGVKILPQKYPKIGVAAFIDFYDVISATEAKEAKHVLCGQELRTNYKANPGEKNDTGRRSHDRERHEDRESDSSSSGSGSGSSSSSSTSDSEQDSKKKARRKPGGAGTLFIKATGLANRTERQLLDGMYYEFCRYSNNVVVQLYSNEPDKKWAVIKYKRADKCKEALTQSQGMMLFGSKLKLTLMDVDDFPPGGQDLKRGGGSHHGAEPVPHQPISEDLDALATRSLFVGNIPKHISVYELRDAFLRYGNVLDVEIKKMGGSATYGFILYYDLMSAVTAKQFMDGHDLKGNKLRVGFGKGTASKQVWIDGIDPAIAEAVLERHLSKYGKIMRLGVDRHRCCAMVQYDCMDSAKEALNLVKGTFIKNSRKLMTDFANRDARAAFFSRMDGGDAGLPPPRGFPGPPGPMYGADMDPRMMMPPRPGGMHMMGRGGYPPHGPPMDFYYNPYMEGFFGGGGRPPYGGPPGMRPYPPGAGRGYGREGPDDYEDELRAFSRKREREKRRRQETSSESSNSPSEKEEENKDDVEAHKKRRASKGKDKGKRVAAKKPRKEPSDEGETGSDSEDQREQARLKATKKSRDLREKLKKLTRSKRGDSSSEEGTSGDDVGKLEATQPQENVALSAQELVRGASSPELRKVRSIPSPDQKKVRKASPDQRRARRASSPFPSSKDRKASPSSEQRRNCKASPSPEQRWNLKASPSSEQRWNLKASPSSEQRWNLKASPSPEQRRDCKASPSPEQKRDHKSSSPSPEQRKGHKSSSPSPELSKVSSPEQRLERKVSSPLPEQKRDRKASPSSEQRKGRKASPSLEQRKGRKASPSLEQKRDRIASPSSEQKRDRKASPSLEQKRDRKASPSLEQRKGRKASSPSPEQRRERKVSLSPEQRRERKVSPSPEQKRDRKASSPSPEQRKGRKASSISPDMLSPREEIHKHKTKNKKVAEKESSLAKRKVRTSFHSPEAAPPSALPSALPSAAPSGVPVQRRQDDSDVVFSEDGSDLERRKKPRGKQRQHGRKERDGKERREGGAASRAKASHKDSNGAAVLSSRGRRNEGGRQESKERRARHSTSDVPMKAGADTPQSPIVSSRSSRSSHHGNIESELSSGEDFKEGNADWANSGNKSSTQKRGKEKLSPRKPERAKDGDHDVDRRAPSSPSRSTPPQPKTPDYPLDEPEWREPHTPPHMDKPGASDEEDLGRKSHKLLPRRYQIEAGSSEQAPGRREGGRYREGKEVRPERRYHAPSPSPPPPQSYPRKRYHHSPPPPEGFDRRRRRPRPYSPGGGGYPQRRRHSRSPPYLGSPPTHRVKSPHVGSPPHSRPRSPIPRVRASRRRHESPPFDGHRSKYLRIHGSPLSPPHHRHPFTPSPPPPRGGARSPPPGRRYGRRRSSSLTPPPRPGRGNRRERSPPPEPMREAMKRHGKRAVFTRSPSPKEKYRDAGKEDYSEQKRRRMLVTRPKSPSGTPPPPSREDNRSGDKTSRQQAPPDSTQPSSSSSSDQRSFKQSTTVSSAKAAEVSTKPSVRSQAAPPKAQSSPAPPPENSLMDLLRRYPVMWQGLLMLKNDSVAVQLHFLSGNVQLANSSLPQQADQSMPILRISQRMRLEKSQLEGVDRRIQTEGEHCLLLALPCGRDASDVHTQTHALKNNLINYLLAKQAAGIINIPAAQGGYVLHIFPPCPFSQSHLSHVAPDLLSNASVNCHLMIVVATM